MRNHGNLAAASIALAALAAYGGSFGAPWLYDDRGSVVDNATIRHLASALRPPASGWPVSGRPLFNLTLALNYAVSGDRTWSYHLLSWLIHLGAGLLLFGIVRRTLAGMGYAPARALALGWAASLLWVLHPLQTESVTYISQRSESLMGMFYLLTVYCFVRSLRSRRREAAEGVAAGTNPAALRPRLHGWAYLSILACLLGMAAKEVMVTAPVMVLLYDRVFVSGGFGAAWRRHRPVYLGLAATWVVLGLLVAHTAGRGGTAGFGSSIPWWAYAVTQFRGVAHYLRLCLWPRPLLFSYGMTLGGPSWEMAADAVVVLGLAAASAVAAVRGSALGFLGLWFFLILAPSSSVVPVATELIAEHRVYLSLAAVAVAVVCGGEFLLRRLFARPAARSLSFAAVAIGLVALAGTAEAAATWHRNRAYGSVLALWADTVEKSPGDAGARNNYGNALAEQGRLEEAVAQYVEALRLVPGYDDPHFNLGASLAKLGRVEEAIPHYQMALRVRPDDANYRYSLGLALRRTGRAAEAREEFGRALAGTAEDPAVWYHLGDALLDEGDLRGADRAFASALRLRPDYADALANHAAVLAQLGEGGRAISEFEAALKLEPDAADVRNNLGGLLAQSGRLAEARAQFEYALRIKPDYREARDNLERVKAMEGSAPGR